MCYRRRKKGDPQEPEDHALVSRKRQFLAAGLAQLELLVGVKQRAHAPPGDYWAERTDAGMVERFGALPVSLALVPGSTDLGLDRDQLRADLWAPDRARLALHLVVSDTSWQLVAPTGALATLARAAETDAATELGRELARVRSAFAAEQGLVITLAPSATYRDLIAAAAAAARDGAGAPLFGRLALGLAPPTPTRRDLRRRLDPAQPRRFAGGIARICARPCDRGSARRLDVSGGGLLRQPDRPVHRRWPGR